MVTKRKREEEQPFLPLPRLGWGWSGTQGVRVSEGLALTSSRQLPPTAQQLGFSVSQRGNGIPVWGPTHAPPFGEPTPPDRESVREVVPTAPWT